MSRYTSEDLKKAVSAYKKHYMSLRKASVEFGVPRSTISDAALGRHPGANGRSTDMKQALVNFVLYNCDRGFPMSRHMIRCYIKEVIRRSDRPTRMNMDTGPTDQWFRNFYRRHPELSERTAENMDAGRTRMSNSVTMAKWFSFLGKVLEENGLKDYPERDGYRAGIDFGQEECLQDGFNAAFTHSSKLLYAVSELRGIVSGKLSYNLMKPGSLSPSQEQLLQTLIGDILEYESELLKFSKDLYSQIQQKRECSIETAVETDREADTSTSCDNRLEVISSTTENNDIGKSEAVSELEKCDNEIVTQDADICTIQQTKRGEEENETIIANRVSHFTARLNEILTSGT